jgi:hypothetical protein
MHSRPRCLPDWIGAHVRMFRFFGGVPRLVVPDNLKSGVHRASFYDPEINRSYGMMAAHYGVGVLPARPRKPRDKAKVEVGVRFAQSYILGRLRHQTFFSLAECNRARGLGWDAMALFGCAPKRPLDYLGSAGLLWAINGGRLLELHRDWAVIDVPVHGSQRTFYRRNVDAAKITLPWARQPAALARQGPRKAGGPPRP